MCYLCKYKEYKYSNNMYNFVIQAFIQYVHQNRILLSELYVARDHFVESKYLLCSHRSQYKTAINNFIEHVKQEEETSIQDTVPTYRMNMNGEYKQIPGEEQ